MGTPQQSYDISQELVDTREYFNRSSSILDEADSNFRPADGAMTAAQQVEHTAQTVDWFIEGASRPEGFDLDFEKHAKALESATSLTAARQHLDSAFDAAIAFLRSLSPEALNRPLPPGPVMGGAPVRAVVAAIMDHSAHHRGALTVYARLLGKVSPMPYM